MTSTSTPAELAAEAAQHFTTATRPDDSSYVKMTDDAPEWIRDMVYNAHADMLPDDWRYSAILSALEDIAESDDPEDGAHEWADAQIDTYNYDRCKWLGSHALRSTYVDNAMADGLVNADEGIYAWIGAGQYLEALEIFDAVFGALQDRAAALEVQS